MKIISTNKKALHDYEVIDKFTAGLVLKWYEVKSIKSGYVNITNARVKVADGAARIVDMDIPLYKKTSLKQIGNYEAKWIRKLLLSKREINKLAEKTHKTWNTIKIIDIYVWQRWYVKITIALAMLMKKIDKKNILKEKDQIREADREIKQLGH